MKSRQIKKNRLWNFAVALIALGGVVLITFLAITAYHFHLVRHNETMTMSDSGAFGDFIAGFVGTIFSLVGVVLLFLTLQDQRDSFYRERLESKFFEMIKLHRDNVIEMYYEKPKERKIDKSKSDWGEKREDKIVTGRKAFNEMLEEFLSVYSEASAFFKTHDSVSMLSKSSANAADHKNNFQRMKIDICYTIIFFGLGKRGFAICKKMLSDRYDEESVVLLLSYLQLKPVKSSKYWEEWQEIDKKNKCTVLTRSNIESIHSMRERYTKYYGGNQYRLGHYYRHLYLSVKYINEENLEYQQKYAYLKMLRAQLSTAEQILFFLNSVSRMGEIWELTPSEKEDIVNYQLITKYNLIKNIPEFEFENDIRVRSFYPLVEYETLTKNEIESIIESRKGLLVQYNRFACPQTN